MAGVKLLRPNVRIRAHYPEAFEDFYNPTAAELNDPKFGFNITCGMTDDYTLNQTASETDTGMTPCDESEVANPTSQNYEVSFDFYRDLDITANGLYNQNFNLFKAAGCPFVISKSLGKPQNDPYVAGDVVSLYGVVTIAPEDILSDREMIFIGARFSYTGEVLIEHEVTA